MRRPGAAKISPIKSMFMPGIPKVTRGLSGGRSVTFKWMPTESQRRYVRVRRVDECNTIDELMTHCLPAFGGAYLRRIYQILDRAIGMGCPMTLAVSGPVTVSGQHQTWLIPLLETGWVAYL